MFKKCLSLVLVGLMLYGANLQIISAQTNTDNVVEKVKTDVFRRGTGEKSKVVVKMKDGTKMKGYISQTGEDSFDLTDSKTKQTTAVAYGDVAQVKKQGLSKGAKIALGIGIAAAVTVVVLGVAISNAADDLFGGSLCCGP
jgi:anaerobic C4-dicarboxylate transporter